MGYSDDATDDELDLVTMDKNDLMDLLAAKADQTMLVIEHRRANERFCWTLPPSTDTKRRNIKKRQKLCTNCVITRNLTDERFLINLLKHSLLTFVCIKN